MKKDQNVTMNENYESPIVELAEFETEVGFAASQSVEETPTTDFSGVLQGTTGTHTY